MIVMQLTRNTLAGGRNSGARIPKEKHDDEKDVQGRGKVN